MKIKKILISQPKPADIERSPYYKIISDYNIECDFHKFIKIEGVTTQEFRSQKIYLQNYGAVIMTSRNAVDNFFRIAKEARYEIPDSLKYFCNSESTAFYLQKYIRYRKRKVFHSNNFPEGIMEKILKHKDEKFLLPCSDASTSEIPELLDKEGIAYKEVVLYKTLSSDLSHLNLNDYDMIVLFTPSGVKSIFDNFPDFKQDKILISAYGEATHKAIKEAGLRLDIETPTPEAPSMSMAIENYLKENQKK